MSKKYHSNIKEYFQDKKLQKYAFFVIFTVSILVILYFIALNFSTIWTKILGILSVVGGAISPIIIGLVLTFLLFPLVHFFQTIMSKRLAHIENYKKLKKREKLIRVLSTLISYLVIITVIVGLLYGFVALILGKLVFASINDMFTQFINYLSSYQKEAIQWINDLPNGTISKYLKTAAEYIFSWISNNFDVSSVLSALSGFVGGIVNFFIGFMISIYLLMDLDYFAKLWQKFLFLVIPKKGQRLTSETTNKINGVLSQFVRGVLLDATIIAVLSSIALSVAGLKYAVFIGIFAGLCNVIPYFGP
ncbi:MAG: AI-2E family transporter, partial [Anaerovoracaceae bacterium]